MVWGAAEIELSGYLRYLSKKFGFHAGESEEPLIVLGKWVTLCGISDLNFRRWLLWWMGGGCWGRRLEVCHPREQIRAWTEATEIALGKGTPKDRSKAFPVVMYWLWRDKWNQGDVHQDWRRRLGFHKKYSVLHHQFWGLSISAICTRIRPF